MKSSDTGRFWPLRPRLTAQRLELACWISALALALALLAATSSTTAGASGPASPASAVATDRTSVPSYAAVLAANYQQRCIRRVIALARYWHKIDVGKQIDRQCRITLVRPTRPQRPARPLAACTEGFNWRPVVVADRGVGCWKS